jgi:hypothetical protein
MNADAMVSGEYLKAAAIGDENPTYTIRSVSLEQLASLKPGAAEDKTVQKGVIWFNDTPLGWVMNKTNVECIKAVWGNDTNAWLGKRVTLRTEMTKTGLGIRLKGSPDLDRPQPLRHLHRDPRSEGDRRRVNLGMVDDRPPGPRPDQVGGGGSDDVRGRPCGQRRRDVGQVPPVSFRRCQMSDINAILDAIEAGTVRIRYARDDEHALTEAQAMAADVRALLVLLADQAHTEADPLPDPYEVAERMASDRTLPTTGERNTAEK